MFSYLSNMEIAKECILKDLNSQEAINLLPVLIYLGIIIVMGCLGNGISLVVYSTKFKQSNSRNFFIFLSAMELMSCILIIPMEVFTLTHHFELAYGYMKCRALMFTTIWQVHVSSATLIVIALDRWRKICHPFKWQISLKLSNILLISLIAVGFVVALPSVSVYSSNPYTLFNVSHSLIECVSGNGSALLTDITIYKCSTNKDLEAIYPQLYVMCFWGMVLVGVALLSFFYWDIKQTVKRQEKKFRGGIGQNPGNRNRFVLQDSAEVENFECNIMIDRCGNNESLKSMSEIGEQLDATEEYDVDEHRKHDNNLIISDDGEQNTDVDIIQIQKRNDEVCTGNGISSLDKLCTGKDEEGVEINMKTRDMCVDSVDIAADASGSHEDVNEDLVIECDVKRDRTHARTEAPKSRHFRYMVRALDNKMIPSVLSKKKRQHKDARSRNVTLIMFVVTVSSVLGFIPYLTLSSMRALLPNLEQNMSTSQYVVYNVFLRSYFLKALTNPIVYGLLDTRFRASVTNLCNR